MKWLGTITTLLFSTLLLNGQTRTFEYVTHSDGLNQNTVYAIYHDVNGEVWIGTQSGLSIYNGANFITPDYQDLNKSVVYAIGGNDRFIWVGTENRLIKFDKSFRSWSTISRSKVTDIQVLDSLVFVATGDAIGCYDSSDSVLVNLEVPQINSIKALEGELYIGSDSGLFKYDRSKGLLPLVRGICVNALLKVQDSVLMGTDSGELYLGSSERKVATLGSKPILDIETDHLNNYWVSTYDGTYVLDQSFNEIDRKEGIGGSVSDLNDPTIYDIYKDQQGLLWFGTRSGGLNIYDYRKSLFDIISIGKIPGRNRENFVWCFTPNKNEILIGTNYSGIRSYDPKTGVFKRNEAWNSLKNLSIQAIHFDENGKIWMGTDNQGFFVFSQDSTGLITRRYRGSRVKTFHSIGNFTYIGGDRIGLIKYNNSSLVRLRTLTKDYVYTIFQGSDQETLWLGTIGEGLQRLNLENDSISKVVTCEESPNSCGLSILDIHEFNEFLIVGTNERGLFFFDKKKNSFVKNITREEGLISNTVYRIEPGRNSDLWLSTKEGICRLKFTETDTIYQNFDKSFGVKNIEFNGGASFFNPRDSSIMFGSTSGIVRFESGGFSELKSNANPDLVKIGIDESHYNLSTDPLPDDKYDFDQSTLEITDVTSVVELTFAFRDHSLKSNQEFQIVHEFDGVSDNPVVLKRNEPFRMVSPGVGLHKLEVTFYHPLLEKLPSNKAVFYVRVYRPITSWLRIITVFLMSLLLLAFIAYFFISNHRKGKIKDRVIKITTRLAYLQELINSVSRSDSVEKVVTSTIDALTDSKLFNFHYATFLKVDYLNNRMVCLKAISKHKEISDPKQWIPTNGIPLGSFDITSQVVKHKRIYKINGLSVNGVKVNLNDPSCILNPEVFRDNNHGDLVRILLPVIQRQQSEDVFGESDRVLGIVEVGYHKGEGSKFDRETENELKLFIDNCAQPLRRIHETSIVREIDSILKISDLSNGDDPEGYLDDVLTKTCEFLKLDAGYIALQANSSSNIQCQESSIFYNKEVRDQVLQNNKLRSAPVYGLLNKCLDSPNGIVFNNNLSSEESYIREMDGAASECAISMIHEKTPIGVVKLFSIKKEFFNEEIQFILKRIFSTIGGAYVNKKFHKAVSDLTMPFNVIAPLSENIQPVIVAIQKYLISDYVSIWMRNYSVAEVKYQKEFVSKAIEREWQEYKNEQVDDEVVLRELRLIKDPNSLFLKNTREYEIVKIVQVPLLVEKHCFGFINIYLRRDLTEIFYEDRQFLEIIAEKTAISMVMSRIINSYSSISKSLVSGTLKENLDTLTNYAREILHADPVILFQCDKNMHIDSRKTVYSGLLNKPQMLNQSSGENFVNYVLKNGDQWFSSRSDFPKKKLGKIGVGGFWDREGIKSMVAVRLVKADVPIGVMFFNYRIDQSFSDFTNSSLYRLVMAFSKLAVAAIDGSNQAEIIKQQQIQLSQKAAKVAFENEEVYKKMQAMLPVSNAASYMEILRAVNHDIRNHLLKIDLRLDEIEENNENLDLIRESREEVTNDIANSTTLINLFEPNSFSISTEIVDEIIESVASLFHEAKDNGIKVNLEGLDCSKSIRCSKAIFSMIIYNVISNARKAIIELWKYNKESGNQKTKFPEGEISIKSEYKSKRYNIEITDNGIGFDNSMKDWIYEAGNSTSEDGLGIGLYFVKETLNQLFAGRISSKSTPQVGTTFYLSFKQQVDAKG